MGHTNGQPEALKAALESMPDVMASLMREFISKKDVTSRIQIRLRMKALLDFAGVDTEYPPNPLKKPETHLREPAREAAMRDGAQVGLQAYPPVGQTEQCAAPPPPPPRVGIDNTNIVQ